MISFHTIEQEEKKFSGSNSLRNNNNQFQTKEWFQKTSKTQQQADLSQSSIPQSKNPKEMGMQISSFCNVDYSKYKSNQDILDKILTMPSCKKALHMFDYI